MILLRSVFTAAALLYLALVPQSMAFETDQNAACTVQNISRASEGVGVWSPQGDRYFLNKKDDAGIYQIYVGSRNSPAPICISCIDRPNSPAANRHKLQPHWHPSGDWIILAGERDNYEKPFFATPELIEGWVQSGIWVNIYATRPDGSRWHRLSDFGHQRGDGFTGVAFTPDGTQAVWAQIVGSPIFNGLFGKWELVLADFGVDANDVPAFSNRRDITPAGAQWVEPGNFSPDGKSLLISADVGLQDAQGMDQFILEVTTGDLRNLTNSPNVWDEHGVFSPDGQKILFMSSYPFQADKFSNSIFFLRTEFMLMNKDGSGLQQLTHFNSPGFRETNTMRRWSVAAVGGWISDGNQITVLNMFFPTYEAWNILFDSSCGTFAPSQTLISASSKETKK